MIELLIFILIFLAVMLLGLAVLFLLTQLVREIAQVTGQMAEMVLLPFLICLVRRILGKPCVDERIGLAHHLDRSGQVAGVS